MSKWIKIYMKSVIYIQVHYCEDVKCYQYFFTTTAPLLYYKYEVIHTIHSVLNTSVKVSGGAHHYLPRKTSLKLC